MVEKLKVGNKNISIYYNEQVNSKTLPVVYFNSFEEDGEKIYDLTDKNYIFVSITNVDWNKEMSPWFMEKLFKSDLDYTGGADKYLDELINNIIPEVEKIIQNIGYNISYSALCGYSLAGLFSVYAMYKTDYFLKIASCSGSLWYPRFAQFAKENSFSSKVETLYFSLGNKEKNTKNELMSKVEEVTIMLSDYYKSYGLDCIYEENEGNHFVDVEERIAKGIKYLVKEN